MSARDLPDGCVKVASSEIWPGWYYDTRDDVAPVASHRQYLALPTPAFEALLDKAGRVEGLEREVAALKGVLGEARHYVKTVYYQQACMSLGARESALLFRIDTLLGDAR